MRISGHKTRAIFDRYDIVDEGDLETAGAALANYFTERKEKRAITRAGEVMGNTLQDKLQSFANCLCCCINCKRLKIDVVRG
jgi:hypothetical protein